MDLQAEAEASYFTDRETSQRSPRDGLRGLRAALAASLGPGLGSTALCLGGSSQAASRESRYYASPGETQMPDGWESVPLIRHIIFGISHSLGEARTSLSKYLNICLQQEDAVRTPACITGRLPTEITRLRRGFGGIWEPGREACRKPWSCWSQLHRSAPL